MGLPKDLTTEFTEFTEKTLSNNSMDSTACPEPVEGCSVVMGYLAPCITNSLFFAYATLHLLMPVMFNAVKHLLRLSC